ncbi:MAG: hypothetical protein KKE17_12315 [Proteobacteria bacterium]|nr:hypothetical protein [Pseudomonadota bacterium]MBU1710782.1 hypothetical protein [Pseudomonadota bacterium]
MADEKDDWLDDFDDGTEDELFSELDQANIDALLGSGDDDTFTGIEIPPEITSEKAASGADADLLEQSTIDALMGGGSDQQKAAEPKEEEELGGELHQSDIDALMGGGKDTAGAPAAEDNQEEVGELDQGDIDSLLGSAMEPLAAASTEEEELGDELDQSDIDSLFGGGEEDELLQPVKEDETKKPALTTAANDSEDGEEDWSDLDQANIDALLSSDASSEISMGINSLVEERQAKPAPAASVEDVPSQEDMDKLFSEASKNDNDQDMELDEVAGKSADFDDEEESVASKGLSALSDDDDFGFADDEDFGFDDDIPDIPEIPEDFVEEEHDEIMVEEESSPDDEATEKIVTPIWLQNAMHNKAVIAITTVCLLLLLGGGVYFLSDKDETVKEAAQIAPQDEVPVKGLQDETITADQQDKVASQVATNAVPLVSSGTYQMSGAAREVPVLLAGQDEDGDPLAYEVVKNPQYGRLLGEPPSMVYLAGNDFPGEDSFDFKVSDGKQTSAPATIVISGPNLRAMAEKAAPAKVVKPTGIMVAASDIVLEGLSTRAVMINWAEIWQQSNDEIPFSDKVSVQLIPGELKGKLEKVNPYMHRYTPDPYASGNETMTYQFKLGKRASKRKTIEMRIASGDPAPKIMLQPLAQEVYTVGQTVVLDASRTIDDNPETLQYVWEQLSGATVRIEPLNTQGSAVSFMAPSDYYTEDQGSLIRLTVVDGKGQRDSREVKVRTATRRHAALWGDSAEADCLSGECARTLLPWAANN